MKYVAHVILLCSFIVGCSVATPSQISLTATAIPTPEVAKSPTSNPIQLAFIPVPTQVAFRGESFLPINLAGFLEYQQLPSDQIIWEVTDGCPFGATIEEGILKPSRLNDPWYGTCEIVGKACETNEMCAIQNIEYRSVDEDPADHVRVTFVGNSGFLITARGKKILIDALFEGIGEPALPSYEVDLLRNAEFPFYDVDVILATHAHPDHFSADMVSQYLEKSPATVFISTSQATSQIKGFENRVISLDARAGSPKETEVNGIRIEAIYLSHGNPPAGMEEPYNNGYIVSFDGFSLFQTGDVNDIRDVEPYNLAALNLDLAFIQHFFFYYSSSVEIIRKNIAAEYVFPIHYLYSDPEINLTEIEREYPSAIIFHSELESWIMP